MSVDRPLVPVALAKFFGESAPVQDSLPIVFSPKSRMDTLQGLCADCGKPIAPELFRGQVRRILPHVVLVEAVGLCPVCGLLTPCSVRVYRDLSMVLFDGKRWRRFVPVHQFAPWLRVLFLLRRLIRWVFPPALTVALCI